MPEYCLNQGIEEPRLIPVYISKLPGTAKALNKLQEPNGGRRQTTNNLVQLTFINHHRRFQRNSALETRSKKAEPPRHWLL